MNSAQITLYISRHSRIANSSNLIVGLVIFDFLLKAQLLKSWDYMRISVFISLKKKISNPGDCR